MRDRVCWDDYYMVEALWARTRSPDKSTQHGCIIVDKNYKPLAQGYNAFPRGCDDEKMPQTRPEKYWVILHSEENAILNCDVSMENAIAYISGPPCIHCWSYLIQKRIAKVVYGPIRSTHSDSPHTKDGPEEDLIQLMLKNQDIEIVEWAPKDRDIIRRELVDIIEWVDAAVRGDDGNA